ncbi:protealysin inhibitor emfourin [Streptomyces sp. NPDC051561]|uniref:protealysin inhibitor emfourin n=1 Tax=Streptomyces sp. NPDC051561 TaxID=3365658 RepID=UPI0037874B38
MLIQVVRTGGFAGIERRAEVDTSGRPDAPAWQALATGALADGRGPRMPGAGIADGFSYEITVDGRTFHCADPQLSDAQRELIERVLKEGA